MEAASTKGRVLGMDLVRTIATFFVICVHFFLHSGFYQGAMIGKRMVLMTMMRWLFFTCVPLFLVLTGYLNRKKPLELKNYRRLFDILGSYLFIAVVTIFFKIFYLKQEASPLEWGYQILDFTASNYAWYVEMYIGLFMIIPFLNLIFQGLQSRNQRKYLLLVLLFMTSAFSITNHTHKILPEYWFSLYPVTYYFIGAYIGEYQIKVKKWILLVSIVLVLCMETGAVFYFSSGSVFQAGSLDTWGAFSNTLVTTFVFLFFYDMDFKQKGLRWFLTDISKVSFDLYLFSFLSDVILYEFLTPFFPDVYSMFPYFLPCVLSSFFLAYLFASIKRFLFSCFKTKRNYSELKKDTVLVESEQILYKKTDL